MWKMTEEYSDACVRILLNCCRLYKGLITGSVHWQAEYPIFSIFRGTPYPCSLYVPYDELAILYLSLDNWSPGYLLHYSHCLDTKNNDISFTFQILSKNSIKKVLSWLKAHILECMHPKYVKAFLWWKARVFHW